MQDQLKHTNGPWQIVGGNSDIVTKSVISKKSGIVICDAPEYLNEDMKQWDANAKLIAAAPELFDFVQKVVVSLRNGGSDDQSELGKLYLEGEQILNKATK
jgi:hypothetical protein